MKLRTFDANKRFRTNRSRKDRRRFYDKNGKRCWYCGKGVGKKKFRLEHQEPFSKGGSCKLAENIVLSCERCDREKRNMTVEEYRLWLGRFLDRDVEFYGERGRSLIRPDKYLVEVENGVIIPTTI